jgi:Flp pilus assembly pilin Flp
MSKVCSWLKKTARKGQTTSEYVIILGLIALGSIGVILLFSRQIQGMFAASTKKAAGQQVDYSDYDQSDQVDEEIIEGIPDALSQD